MASSNSIFEFKGRKYQIVDTSNKLPCEDCDLHGSLCTDYINENLAMPCGCEFIAELICCKEIKGDSN